jgi:hypothetical protein
LHGTLPVILQKNITPDDEVTVAVHDTVELDTQGSDSANDA